MKTQITQIIKPFRCNRSMTGKRLLRVRATRVMLLTVGIGTWAGIAMSGQRPISDFLSRQSKFCVQLDANGFDDCTASHYVADTTGGGCFLFIPPVADYTGLSDPKAGLSASF